MENKWTSKYILDIEKIDEQHKLFFDLWNDELENVDKHDNVQTAAVILKLENYLKAHLKYEEALMIKAGYEGYDMHVAQHKFFISKVQDLKQELNYSNPLLFEKTALFMKKWFLHHIIQSDSKYQAAVTEYLKSK